MWNRTTTRRAYLVAVGAAGLISLAGCSSDETDGSGTEQTDGEPTSESSEQNSDDTSISTEGRDYSQIEYDVEVGDELSEALATIEQSTDTSVVDQINTFEVDMVREESYCTVEDTGVQTLESTEEEGEEYDVPEEAEVDTYGIDIEVQCNQDLVAEQATSIAGGIFIGFFDEHVEDFYDPRTGELINDDSGEEVSEFLRNHSKGEAISDISLEIEAENGTGSVQYDGLETDEEGYSVARLLDSVQESYQSDTTEGVAVDQQVQEDFEFS